MDVYKIKYWCEKCDDFNPIAQVERNVETRSVVNGLSMFEYGVVQTDVGEMIDIDWTNVSVFKFQCVGCGSDILDIEGNVVSDRISLYKRLIELGRLEKAE